MLVCPCALGWPPSVDCLNFAGAAGFLLVAVAQVIAAWWWRERKRRPRHHHAGPDGAPFANGGPGYDRLDENDNRPTTAAAAATRTRRRFFSFQTAAGLLCLGVLLLLQVFRALFRGDATGPGEQPTIDVRWFWLRQTAESLVWAVVTVALLADRFADRPPAYLAAPAWTGVVLAALPCLNLVSYYAKISQRALVIEVLYYSIVVVLALLLTPTPCIRRDGPSAWANFSRKLSVVGPYVWPRESLALQIRVAACCVLLVIGRLINVALPLYSKWIVDELTTPGHFPMALIVAASALKFLQGSGAMGGLLNTARTWIWLAVQQWSTRAMELRLFSHLLQLPLSWHLGRKTGQVLRVMDRGTQSVNQILNYLLFNIAPTLADIAIAVVFFFSAFSWLFGLLVLGTMIVYLVLTIVITEWRTKFNREMNEKDNAVGAIGTDSLLNYETVKYFSNEHHETDRFRKAIEEYQGAEWRSQLSLALLNSAQNSLIGVAMAAGTLLVAYLVSKGDSNMSVGDYVLFTTYILQLYTPLNFFGTFYRVIQKSFIDMENMFELVDERIEFADQEERREFEPADGDIRLEHVSFGYSSEKTVLHDISLHVPAGKTLALVGASGSGKSTVLRLLFRFADPTEGRITVDGQDIAKVEPISLRRHIAVVPQDTVLFNAPILDNIRYGRLEANDEEVHDAARAAQIHDRILDMPLGYGTVVGERGLRLSGGEKQRVAIARALLKRPKLVLLDEATSALDSATERQIQRCIDDVCRGRTTVCVAHRLSTIAGADQIALLAEGRVVEQGTHAELLAIKNGRYAKLWELQQAEEASGAARDRQDAKENEVDEHKEQDQRGH